MAHKPRKWPSWLAVCSGLLLAPTALLGAAFVALIGPLEAITLLGLLHFALVVIVLLGAWAVRTTPQPMLWGRIILGSSFVQFFLGLAWLGLAGLGPAWWPIDVTFQLVTFLLGVILGMMSGIWLIAEQRGSTGQT